MFLLMGPVFARTDRGAGANQGKQSIAVRQIPPWVFQEPMPSLNPVLTIGLQLTETMMLHLGRGQPEADRRAVELLDLPLDPPECADPGHVSE